MEKDKVGDRLKSLVECTADDIKTCSNVCDTYTKKRLISKVLLSPRWNMDLLAFVDLFATRRRDFEFELAIHTNRGVDNANVKIDAITEQFGYLYICSGYALISW